MDNGTYMTFIFTPETLKKLLDSSPDYVLMNVGYTLIPDPANDKKKVAQLVVNGEGWKKDAKTPILTVAGCPVPPCDPTHPGGN